MRPLNTGQYNLKWAIEMTQDEPNFPQKLFCVCAWKVCNSRDCLINSVKVSCLSRSPTVAPISTVRSAQVSTRHAAWRIKIELCHLGRGLHPRCFILSSCWTTQHKKCFILAHTHTHTQKVLCGVRDSSKACRQWRECLWKCALIHKKPTVL